MVGHSLKQPQRNQHLLHLRHHDSTSNYIDTLMRASRKRLFKDPLLARRLFGNFSPTLLKMAINISRQYARSPIMERKDAGEFMRLLYNDDWSRSDIKLFVDTIHKYSYYFALYPLLNRLVTIKLTHLDMQEDIINAFQELNTFFEKYLHFYYKFLPDDMRGWFHRHLYQALLQPPYCIVYTPEIGCYGETYLSRNRRADEPLIHIANFHGIVLLPRVLEVLEYLGFDDGSKGYLTTLQQLKPFLYEFLTGSSSNIEAFFPVFKAYHSDAVYPFLYHLTYHPDEGLKEKVRALWDELVGMEPSYWLSSTSDELVSYVRVLSTFLPFKWRIQRNPIFHHVSYFFSRLTNGSKRNAK